MVKNPPANAGDTRDAGSISGREDPLEEGMATHSSILAGKSHGQRSLVGYSPRGRKESDTTEVNQRASSVAQQQVRTMHRQTGSTVPIKFTDKVRRLAQGPVCQTLLEKIKEALLYLSRIFAVAPRTKKAC